MRAHDVTVRNLAREPDLALEPLERARIFTEHLLLERLDGDHFTELGIDGLEDDAHATHAEHLLHLVAAGELHPWRDAPFLQLHRDRRAGSGHRHRFCIGVASAQEVHERLLVAQVSEHRAKGVGQQSDFAARFDVDVRAVVAVSRAACRGYQCEHGPRDLPRDAEAKHPCEHESHRTPEDDGLLQTPERGELPVAIPEYDNAAHE